MDRRAWALFAAVTLCWGIPYFFIKSALHDLSPAMIAELRVLIGGAVLAPLALARLRGVPLRHRLGWLVLLALTEVTAPFLLIAGGETRISSSLTAILIASEPMLVALLALPVDRAERVGGWRLSGMIVGLVGVVVLLGLGKQSASALIGAVMILAATACYATGALVIKLRFSDVPALVTVTLTLALSTMLLLVPALLSAPSHGPSAGTVAALLILGIPCTSLGFLAFFALIGRVGAGRATVITYVTPVVAVALGVAAGGEHLGSAAAAGLALILAGSWLSTSSGVRFGRLRRRQALASTD